MRVLIAHNRYRVEGGEDRHVELLGRGLAEAGLQVRRYEKTSSVLEEGAVQKAFAGLTVAYRPGGGGIRPILREWQPSVVHFHNIWPLLTPSALRAAKASGAVVVMTIHNYRFACPGGTLLRGSVIHEDCIYGSSLRCALRNPRGNRAESMAYGFALEIQRRFSMLRRWVDVFIAPSQFMARMLVAAGVPYEQVKGVQASNPCAAHPTRMAGAVGSGGEGGVDRECRMDGDAVRSGGDVVLPVVETPVGADREVRAQLTLWDVDRGALGAR